ncbi:putative protein kinase C [Microsporum audouinii]
MSLIKQPPRLARYPFLSLGAIGLVYKIDEEIVLKIPRGNRSDAFLREIKIGGTLDQRFRAHQVRVETVTAQEPIELVKQWSMELSHAAAWLENLGYVHADIRPPNLLLNGDDRVEAGDDAGSFGLYGARTEQFAIGSVIYLMTRGYEPYEDEDPGPNIVELRRMEFPSLGNDPLDRIIDRCWKGRFEYLKDLAEETSTLSGGNHPKSLSPLTERYCLERQKKCQTLVNQGLLEWEV